MHVKNMISVPGIDRWTPNDTELTQNLNGEFLAAKVGTVALSADRYMAFPATLYDI